MNEVMDFGKTIIGGADGPTSVFLAGNLGTGLNVAVIISGLLLCFFGLKLTRVLAALTGLSIGSVIGFGIASAAKTEGMVFLAIVGACAVVAALLSFFLYKLGVFLIVFFAVLAFATSILITVQGTVFSVSLGKGSMLAAGIAAVAALVCAVLSVIFSEPVIIIATAVSGGMSVGPALLKLSGVGAELWMRYAAGAAFIVLGMGVQFVMHSRKIGKKEKIYAEENKEKNSVESEVEKARMILDDDDEEE